MVPTQNGNLLSHRVIDFATADMLNDYFVQAQVAETRNENFRVFGLTEGVEIKI